MKSVKIAPQTAYANGKQMIASAFNLVSVSDNLFDHVIFKYTLLTENGAWAGESTYELKGKEAYSQWDASPEGAYSIVANGIGLEIVQTLENEQISFMGV